MNFRSARTAVPMIAAVLGLCVPVAAQSGSGQAGSQQQAGAAQSGTPAQGQGTQGQGSQAQPPQAQPVPQAQPPATPTLGELAQQEAARRKGLKPKKVYTDKDAKPYKAPEPSPAAAKGDEGAKPAEGSEAAKPGAAESKDAEKPKGEEYWRTRMTDAQEALRKDEMFRDALQSRINGLTADYTSRDDPAQRAVIGEERQKALAELARVTEGIEQDKKRIADIEDEARRAGVPPGWIR